MIYAHVPTTRTDSNIFLEGAFSEPKGLPKTHLTNQIGGDHYKTVAIQPIEYIHANGLGFFEGNVIKYVTRWKAKNGLEDLKKAIHYLEMLIELEGNKLTKPQ